MCFTPILRCKWFLGGFLRGRALLAKKRYVKITIFRNKGVIEKGDKRYCDNRKQKADVEWELREKGEHMNQMKKLLCICLALLMVFGMTLFACAAEMESADMIPADVANEIFDKYPAEISYVEEKYDASITKLDATTDELIGKEAASNYTNENFDFSGLMTELSLAKARYSAGAMTRQLRTNELYEVHRSYGPIAGEIVKEVSVGTTSVFEGEFEVILKKGDEVYGVELSARCKVTESYEVRGPEDGTTLLNEHSASHRIAAGVLMGTIIKYSYDLHDSWTGTMEHCVEYYIEDKRGVSYTFLAFIGNPTYIQKASNTGVVTCSHYLDFENRLWDNPGQFIQ